MQTGKPDITDVFSQLLYESGDNGYYVRVIKFKNQQGETVTKFGFSQFWYCESLKTWLPSKTRHLFLPAHVWPTLVSQAKLIEKLLKEQTAEQAAEQSPRTPAPTTAPTTAPSTAPNRDDVDRHSGSSGDATNKQPPAKRQRGRPPKRANELGANNGIVVDATGGTRTNSAGAQSDEHQSKAQTIKKGKYNNNNKTQHEAYEAGGGFSDLGGDDGNGTGSTVRGDGQNTSG